jgi:hypothetical protein
MWLWMARIIELGMQWVAIQKYEPVDPTRHGKDNGYLEMKKCCQDLLQSKQDQIARISNKSY